MIRLTEKKGRKKARKRMNKFVIISGISGAGKTETAKCFEDMGFHSIYNIPAPLLFGVIKICPHKKINRMVLILDTGEVGFSRGIFFNLKKLSEMGINYKLIFLDASDEVITRRFEQRGTFHPWAKRRELLKNIAIERKYLERLRKEAHLVIDTSELTLQDLRWTLERWVNQKLKGKITISNIGSYNIFRRIPIEDERKKYINSILSNLDSIKTEEKEKIFDLLDSLSKFVGFEIKERCFLKDMTHVKADMEKLRIRVDENTLFIILHQGINKDILSNVEDIIRRENAQNEISFIITFCDSTKIRQWVKNSYYQIVVLDNEDLRRIFSSYDSTKVFIKYVVEQIGLREVSPYYPMGPTRNFYGRDQEIKEILGNDHKSYVIVGGRKMGKSSLLLKLRKEMEKEKENSEIISIDCSPCKNYEDFFSLVCQRLGDEEREIKDMVSFSSYLTDKGKKIVFLLDEIDNLLEIDQKNDYNLISTLRDLAFRGYIKCIIAGFKELYFQSKDIDSPFYHFTDFLHLSILDKPTAENLIREPMGNLGIRFVDPIKNINKILSLTSLHPSCIQFFCEKLIEYLSKSDRRIVSERIIEMIYGDSKFEDYILKTLKVDFGKFEEMIIYNTLNLNFPISLESVQHILKSQNLDIKIDEVRKALDNLILSGVFSKNGREYSFLFDKLPTIIKNNIETRYILKENLRERVM